MAEHSPATEGTGRSPFEAFVASLYQIFVKDFDCNFEPWCFFIDSFSEVRPFIVVVSRGSARISSKHLRVEVEAIRYSNGAFEVEVSVYWEGELIENLRDIRYLCPKLVEGQVARDIADRCRRFAGFIAYKFEEYSGPLD